MMESARYAEIASSLALVPTLDRLTAATEHAGMFARIDHAAGAKTPGGACHRRSCLSTAARSGNPDPACPAASRA
jgi:hypothetical protein